MTPAWDNWAGFEAGLQRQLGVIDAKGEARIRLKNLKQGKRSVTEYWNEFRLVASEAELDDSTGGELLLGGMIAELQNAWGASSEEYEDLEALAQWAIRKETKLATVRHIQGSPSTKNIQRRPPHRETQMGHTGPLTMAMTITATQWNWTRHEKDQDSISQGKNSKEGYENNYASSVHNQDTGPGVARKKMD